MATSKAKAKSASPQKIKMTNPKIIFGALVILALIVVGGIIAYQSVGLLSTNQDNRSRAGCISCGGGSCPDGWSYGPDRCAPHRSCAQRASEACAAHQRRVTPTPRRGGSRPF